MKALWFNSQSTETSTDTCNKHRAEESTDLLMCLLIF